MRRWGLLGSFGTLGDCFDNTATEPFWARMQVELHNTRIWVTAIRLAAARADYIDNFYNVERRRHIDRQYQPRVVRNALAIRVYDLYDPSMIVA